ncbi:mechanosensitive ion channel family protein [Corynebacterium alimapuense]|uniref:Mechanosensitive ion channel protein MscS n=1 Tax=Corynebacterium alimapuense TaxID=1576874 RepID=A0A3M8K8V6_9CORY|nr:mechanosensitive ion channel family protein [Corynebacterium alimapuense]RNE49663.1 mechanosensitive ion channel protein MscS [Corynebacterium alimapuense]
MTTATTEQSSIDAAVESFSSWQEQPTVQVWLVERPIQIAIILLVATVAHWLLRRLIDRLAKHNVDSNKKLPNFASVLNRKQKVDEEASEQKAALLAAQEQRRQARVRTLSDVGKSAVSILVWSWAVISILSTLGINVAPIIASAGVAGVALGFGAQSLVKDFVSGIFMLLEDQYGVGDTIDVGDGVSGTVEEVTLRVTTLRDIDGTLWYVRNGEILRVGNFSDEYSIARIQVPVGLSNDAERAADVILASAAQAVTDPSIADAVLNEPVFNGITDLATDHLSMRLSVETRPGQQWAVQRVLLIHALRDMQAAGITTPYPHGVGIHELPRD